MTNPPEPRDIGQIGISNSINLASQVEIGFNLSSCLASVFMNARVRLLRVSNHITGLQNVNAVAPPLKSEL